MVPTHKGLATPRLLMPILASRTSRHLAFSQDALDAGLKGLVLMNVAWLKHYPETPALYDSGVIYRPEFAVEDWETIPYIIYRGYGDCEDLASWRAAELRGKGINAWSVAKLRRMPNGAIRGHAVVRYPSGREEDPSARLGMYLYTY